MLEISHCRLMGPISDPWSSHHRKTKARTEIQLPPLKGNFIEKPDFLLSFGKPDLTKDLRFFFSTILSLRHWARVGAHSASYWCLDHSSPLPSCVHMVSKCMEFVTPAGHMSPRDLISDSVHPWDFSLHLSPEAYCGTQTQNCNWVNWLLSRACMFMCYVLFICSMPLFPCKEIPFRS